MNKKARNILSGLFTCLFLLTGEFVIAQSKNQLAFEYYRNNEFDKAATLFLELYDDRNNQHYRNYYIQSLVKDGDLKTAEKFIKEELRRYKNDIGLQIEQAYIWEEQGKTEKANKAYQEIIENETRSKQAVTSLANNFMQKRKFDLAEQTYLSGQENISNENFYYQLANLYAIQRKHKEMTEAYMDLLADNPSYLTNVQTRLQRLAARDIDESLNPILEQALISRIQNNPDKTVFSEMLIWQYVQTGQYNAAKNQAIALDRRRDEQGKRLYELGKMASKNDKKEVAADCFEYVYQFGRTSPYYFASKLIELSDTYTSLRQENHVDNQMATDLAEDIKRVRAEAPRKLHYQLTVLLVRIQAFYLDKEDYALQEIDSILNTGRLDKSERSEIELLRGDINLINDNPWEASLIYAKIEQDNKDNPLGSEAKFRKAKMAYYTGQFEWAKAQLDVLKASTSKLIANDAFELSLFIKENVMEDSLEIAMKMFAHADLHEFKHNYDSALMVLDTILQEFPADELTDNVLFRKGRIKARLGEYENAVDLYNQVVSDHGWGMLADNALIAMGRLQEEKLNNPEAAMESFKQILLNHPGSIFVTEARESVRRLRGDTPGSGEEISIPEPGRDE
ncbi:MAG: tetratricopeptide repeat protein [Bacteroidales bacterium]